MTILKFNKEISLDKIEKSNRSSSRSVITNNSKKFIFFSKYELTSILNLYSKQVSKGFWKDYALDSTGNTAIFSKFELIDLAWVLQKLRRKYQPFINPSKNKLLKI